MAAGAADVCVAVTDQGSRKIIVLDPAVADWDLAAAVKWSWAPSLNNGFDGLMHGWGLPSGVKLRESELWGGHGVLWDPEKELLWALGDDYLVALRVGGTPARPALTKVHEAALPTAGGHDLAPVYGNTDRLWITTRSRVYQYEKSTDTWLTSYVGGDATALAHVKGVGNLPGGRIVMTQQKAGTLYPWTTDTVTMLLPDGSRTRTGAAFYKARVWHAAYQ